MTRIGRNGAEWRNHEQNEQAQTDANRYEGWTKLWSGGGALAVARWWWSGGGALAVARWWWSGGGALAVARWWWWVGLTRRREDTEN